MENKKTLELIRLSTIGCAGKSDFTALSTLMAEDENFPWKELGEYQNLAALLPSVLVLETPGWELKDKVAKKLYELRDEITTKVKEPEQPEEVNQPVEQTFEEPAAEFEVQKDVVSNKTPDLFQLNLNEQPADDVLYESKIEKREPKSKTVPDKDLVEKTVRDYVKSYYKDELEIMQKGIKKSLLISVILFIIALLLLVFIYFKFSGEADSNRQEIDKIKDRLGISLIEFKAEEHSSLG